MEPEETFNITWTTGVMPFKYEPILPSDFIQFECKKKKKSWIKAMFTNPFASREDPTELYENPTWTEVNKPEETLCGYTARELQSLIEENTHLHDTIKKLQGKVEALEPFEKLFMEYVKNGHSGASN